MIFCDHTPIEIYELHKRHVYVKRDDLFGVSPASPLGKLRGLKALLRSYEASGVQLLGCWDTRVSRLGEGLAAACSQAELRAVVCFPTRPDGSVPPSVQRAQQLGARIHGIRGNHVSICHAQSRRFVESLGGMMLPFGMECIESVDAVAKEAARVPAELCSGTVILCCGSGVTISGLLKGFRVDRSFLLRHGIQEYLFVRDDEEDETRAI